MNSPKVTLFEFTEEKFYFRITEGLLELLSSSARDWKLDSIETSVVKSDSVQEGLWYRLKLLSPVVYEVDIF